jgi:hypothetical protein
MHVPVLCTLAAVFMFTGLGHSELRGQTTESGSQAAAALRYAQRPADRDVLTGQDWRSTAAPDAYTMLEALKPFWLRARPSAIAREPAIVVYVNGTRWGTAEVLRDIKVPDLVRIRHLSGAHAAAQFGPDHTGGALLVQTR